MLIGTSKQLSRLMVLFYNSINLILKSHLYHIIHNPNLSWNIQIFSYRLLLRKKLNMGFNVLLLLLILLELPLKYNLRVNHLLLHVLDRFKV